MEGRLESVKIGSIFFVPAIRIDRGVKRNSNSYTGIAEYRDPCMDYGQSLPGASPFKDVNNKKLKLAFCSTFLKMVNEEDQRL